MKTYEELLGKPKKSLLKDPSPKEVIEAKYAYAWKVFKYNKRDQNIGEPIEKICRRILEKPERFVCLEEGSYRDDSFRGWLYPPFPIVVSLVKVLQDKDTQQKFVFNRYSVLQPSFLNEIESCLLKEVSEEWYTYHKDKIREDKEKKEQLQKNKSRQEMIDLYKDL